MGKIITLRNLNKELKNINDKIVLVGGCFDILHPGHIEFLNRAKKLGGKLVILLESNATVKRLKGSNRPINNQKNRAIILSSLSMVDYVISLPHFKTDSKYFELVKKIKPDIIAVSNGDPLIDKKRRQAKIVNGKVIIVMKRQKKYSTKNIAERLAS